MGGIKDKDPIINQSKHTSQEMWPAELLHREPNQGQTQKKSEGTKLQGMCPWHRVGLLPHSLVVFF